MNIGCENCLEFKAELENRDKQIANHERIEELLEKRITHIELRIIDAQAYFAAGRQKQGYDVLNKILEGE